MRRSQAGLFLILGVLAAAGSVTSARAQTLFTDVTAQSGTSFLHTGLGLSDNFMGTGAAWFDYDRDGDLDLYVTRRVGANVLFTNNGDSTFSSSNSLGLSDATNDGAGVAVADFDNDGWLDVYLANSNGDALYRNVNGLSFQDVTAAAGLTDVGNARGTSASWGDYDADGFLDLYVSNHMNMAGATLEHRNRLYHNNGDGTFTHVLPNADVSDADGFSFIGAWTDYDDDGDADIFLVNDCAFGGTGTNVFRNDGGVTPETWVFTEVSAQVGADHCRNGMGIAIGDFDRDGLLDYFYSNARAPLLLRNSDGGFLDVTQAAGVDEATVPATGKDRWTWGCNFFDYDLDGWLDLHVSSGGMRQLANEDPQPNLLYKNDGNGTTFSDVSDTCGANVADRSRTGVTGDYDGDGDADLFVVNYEEDARLFRNDNASGYHYLAIDLQGVVSNRDGIGARMRVKTPDGLYQYAEVHSGTSLGGGDEMSARFGLGSHPTVSELLIRWPSGLVMMLTGLAGDQRLTVVEDTLSAPAQVVGVSAELALPDVRVNWETRYEQRLATMQVEHRLAGGTFTMIGEVTGRGTTLRPGAYSYDVPAPVAGTHEFRIRSVRDDGSSGTSEIVSLVVTSTPVLFRSFSATPLAKAVDVRWELWSDEPMDGVSLLRRDSHGVPVEVAAGDARTTRSFIDVSVVPGRRYRYQLIVRTRSGNLFRSPVRSATVPAPAAELSQNFPNPFNPRTTIAYTLERPTAVVVEIFDASGALVVTIDDGRRDAGSYQVQWDGRDAAGRRVAGGLYFYRLAGIPTGGGRKMLLLK